MGVCFVFIFLCSLFLYFIFCTASVEVVLQEYMSVYWDPQKLQNLQNRYTRRFDEYRRLCWSQKRHFRSNGSSSNAGNNIDRSLINYQSGVSSVFNSGMSSCGGFNNPSFQWDSEIYQNEIKGDRHQQIDDGSVSYNHHKRRRSPSNSRMSAAAAAAAAAQLSSRQRDRRTGRYK